ncbi:MAG: hypothetical protein IJ635_07565 [Bacteroidaceae bacterium]|nr:hypothetical protein [Bacteroidaceae bacterium]
MDTTTKPLQEFESSIEGITLQQIDNFDLYLSEQEEKDLQEIDKLFSETPPKNLASEIWSTIKTAALDSVEQIIGLDDRGDWRSEQGAVVTTPLNFRAGVVATENDRKRYEMWKQRVEEKIETPKQFRERVINPDFQKTRDAYKKSLQRPDGSYENAYNGKPLYDRDNPKAYYAPDSSGDMTLNTKATVDVDHINSVKKLVKDDKVALYSLSDKEGFEQDIKTIANDERNLAITDAHGNRSIKDKDTYEQAKNNPDLEWDADRVKQVQNKANNAKNKHLLQNAWKEKGLDLAKGVGKSTLAATGKMLVGKTIKITINETYLEFTKPANTLTEADSYLERAKRLIKKILARAKRELWDSWHGIAIYAGQNALAEITNLIINYFLSTVKNLFKLIRCMIGSILKAIKMIFDSSRPWEERLFEAIKIISGGIVLAAGVELNELLDKAISTNIPFLAPISTEISAVISGLVSSILSALVLLAFDNIKGELFAESPYDQLHFLNRKILCTTSARISLAALRTDMMMRDTYDFMGHAFYQIGTTRTNIIHQHEIGKQLDNEIASETEKLKDRNRRLGALADEFINDDNF